MYIEMASKVIYKLNAKNIPDNFHVLGTEVSERLFF